MHVDFINIWLTLVIIVLFGAAIICIVLGITPPESDGDSIAYDEDK